MNYNDQKLFIIKKCYKVLFTEVRERKNLILIFSIDAKEQNQLLVFNLTRILLVERSKLQCFICCFTKTKVERMHSI